MSLKTWKKEFYPKEANKTTEKEAITHSLKKWTGLTKANLKKHGLISDGTSIYDIKNDEIYFDIDCDTCALCFHYFEKLPIYCAACPLYKIRGGFQCDECSDKERDKLTASPYGIFTTTGNPIPMINLLKKALKDSVRRSK